MRRTTANCVSRISSITEIMTAVVVVKVFVFVGLAFVCAVDEVDEVAEVHNTERDHAILDENVGAEDYNKKLEE